MWISLICSIDVSMVYFSISHASICNLVFVNTSQTAKNFSSIYIYSYTLNLVHFIFLCFVISLVLHLAFAVSLFVERSETYIIPRLRMKNSKKPQEKPDRKTVERNRRIHMKALCFKLTSLIPRQHLKPTKNMLWQPDQLDQATNYIKQLKERVEVLKSRKELLETCDVETDSGGGGGNSTTFGIRFPRFEFRDFGSGLEVVLVTEMRKQIMLYEIISILKEEGAEVVSANVSRVGDKAYYTLHAQVRVSRVGVDTSRVCERLQQLIS